MVKRSKTVVLSVIISLFVLIFGIGILYFKSRPGNSNFQKPKWKPLSVDEVKAIRGEDQDADGVRDDVQAFINSTYPESAKVRAALGQIAKSLQLAIENPENALATQKPVYLALSCLEATLPNLEIYGEISEQLEAAVVNSDVRSRAYIRYDANLSGQTFSITRGKMQDCSFNSAELAN
jgi:hypothetical protein